MNKRTLIILVFLLLPFAFFAQSKPNKKMIKANEFYEAGEYFKAKEMYIKLYSKAKQKEEKAEISFKVGLCSRNLFETQNSITWFRRAILYKYQDPIVNLYLGDALKMRGLYDDAKEYYENYKELVPGDIRGENGIKSCELAVEWMDNPSRYVVEPIAGLNSNKNDFAPAIGTDTNLIFFTSTRTSTSGDDLNNNSGQNFADLFVSQKDTKGNWSQPVPLQGGVNTEFDDGSCSVTPSGRVMYFTQCPLIDGANAGCKIYKSVLSNEQWSEPELIDIFPDSSISVGHPAITTDELTLYFVADNPNGSVGGKDIWKITRASKTSQWGKPTNLGADINTQYDELYPTVDNQGNLYFSTSGRIGMGGLDIFKATPNDNGGWAVENLKSPINSSDNDFGIVFYKGDDSRGYFSSSRNAGKGDDIFSFYLKPIVVSLKGYVINDANHAYLPDVDVEISGSDGNMIKVKTDNTGAFNTRLNANVDYLILTSKKTYLKATGSVSTKGVVDDGKIFETMIYMKPSGVILQIENIQYDFGDTTLREESKVALDELIDILNINPTITIELRANTDFRGSEPSNLKLSQGRANSVVNYLVANGIKRDRLVAKGYGESVPFKVNQLTAQKYPFLKEGDVLNEQYINSLQTEEQKEICHELNRRTEFQVLSTNYGPNFENFGD